MILFSCTLTACRRFYIEVASLNYTNLWIALMSSVGLFIFIPNCIISRGVYYNYYSYISDIMCNTQETVLWCVRLYSYDFKCGNDVAFCSLNVLSNLVWHILFLKMYLGTVLIITYSGTSRVMHTSQYRWNVLWCVKVNMKEWLYGLLYKYDVSAEVERNTDNPCLYMY